MFWSSQGLQARGAAAMDGEIAVTQRQLREFLAQTERRFAKALEQLLGDVEARLEIIEGRSVRADDHWAARLSQVEARLDVVQGTREAQLDVVEVPVRWPHAEYSWPAAVETAAQSHLKISGISRCVSQPSFLSDVEMEVPRPRRLLPDAEHCMPHPDKDNYTVLSAREVPPLTVTDERSPGSGQFDKEPNNSADENPTKDYKDLPLDTWGSGIICIIEEVPKIFTGTAGYPQFLRTGFALACLVVNIVLQYLLLWFVLKYVCNPAVAKLQTLYKAYHASCFAEDGTFMEVKWHNFEYRQELCDMALSEPAFVGTMLMIWVSRMLGEFRSVVYLVRSIESIPKVPHQSLMINLYESELGTIHEIVGLTHRVCFCLHLFITVPQFGINLWLTYMGVRWLASTVSFSDLILNALALQFIVEIDEILLRSLYPERMISALQRAKFAPPRTRLSPEEDQIDLKKRYHQAIVATVSVFLIVLIYLVGLQQVLPHFSWDVNSNICANVMKERFTPKCTFGMGTHDCFPFGGNVTNITSFNQI